MSRITVSDLNKVSFYQIPKSFFHNIEYITMSSEAKLAYTLLYDLLELSAQNNWVNDEGEVYIKLSREKLMLRLNIRSKTTASKVMKELIRKGLIEEKRVGVNKCNEIYICTPKELSQIYRDDDLVILREENNKNKGVKHSDINGSTENGLPEVQKMDDQKMNFKKSKKCTHTNTKSTNTKFSSSSSSKEHDVIGLFEKAFNKKPSVNMQRNLNTFISKSNEDFIKEVIIYCMDQGAEKPTYLINTLKKLIIKNITTVEEFRKSIEEHYTRLEKDLSNGRKVDVKNPKKQNKSNKKPNFTQREDYDYNDLEKKLLGYDLNDCNNILSTDKINDMLNKYRE